MAGKAVIDFLNTHHDGSEAARAHTFVVWIHNQEVTVELHDRGAGTGSQRFYAHAYWSGKDLTDAAPNADGYTIGNPDSTAEMALMNLHWNVFRAED